MHSGSWGSTPAPAPPPARVAGHYKTLAAPCSVAGRYPGEKQAKCSSAEQLRPAWASLDAGRGKNQSGRASGLATCLHRPSSGVNRRGPIGAEAGRGAEADPRLVHISWGSCMVHVTSDPSYTGR